MSIAYYAVLLTQLICFSGEALRRVQGSSDVNDPPGTSNSPPFFGGKGGPIRRRRHISQVYAGSSFNPSGQSGYLPTVQLI